jgi:hypothetical protein
MAAFNSMAHRLTIIVELGRNNGYKDQEIKNIIQKYEITNIPEIWQLSHFLEPEKLSTRIFLLNQKKVRKIRNSTGFKPRSFELAVGSFNHCTIGSAATTSNGFQKKVTKNCHKLLNGKLKTA